MKTLLSFFVLTACWATALVPAARSEQPHLVMLIAEREYLTDQSLANFSRDHLAGDYRVTTVLADPDDRNRFEGIEAVSEADVLLVSVRRRAIPTAQLALIRQHVQSGKPVVGIRTANHAFSLRKQDPPAGRAVWPEWDQEVFGGNYTNHYGNQLRATIRREKENAAPADLLAGIGAGPFSSGGSLYKVAPLAKGTEVVLTGEVDGHPAEPVAWTFQRKDGGKSFYTSLGHVDDFQGKVLPPLLVNAIRWSLASSDADAASQ